MSQTNRSVIMFLAIFMEKQLQLTCLCINIPYLHAMLGQSTLDPWLPGAG